MAKDNSHIDWTASQGGSPVIHADNYTGGGGGGGALQFTELLDQTFSGQSSVDVDCTGYDQVQLVWEDVSFSASDRLALRVSTDGVTFDAGATDYRRLSFSGVTPTNDASDQTYLHISAHGNGQDTYGSAHVFNMSSANHRTQTKSIVGDDDGSDMAVRVCYRKTAQTDTHLRIIASGGSTIDSGRLRVLGVGKSTVGGTGGPAVLKCRARPAADLTAINATAGYTVPLDAEDFDVGGWHDNVTNNTRMTVPVNAKDEVDVSVYVRANNVTADTWGLIEIHKDGAFYRRLNIQTDRATVEGGLVLRNEVVVPGTTYFELLYRQETDTSVDIETETNITISESIQTHSDGHEINPSTPDANIQGVVNQIDVITMSSMTANRDYLLPTTAAVGQIAGISIVDGDPSFEVLIKSGAAGDKINNVDHSTNEFTRLFIAGERMVFECIDAAGPHWQVKEDGRIKSSDAIGLTANSPSLSAATYTAFSAFDGNGSTKWSTSGDLINATNGRATIRRSGTYVITGNPRLNDNLADGQTWFARVNLDPDGTPIVVVIGGSAVGASANAAAGIHGTLELNAGDVLEYEVYRQNAGTLFGAANIQSAAAGWAITEQL